MPSQAGRHEPSVRDPEMERKVNLGSSERLVEAGSWDDLDA